MNLYKYTLGLAILVLGLSSCLKEKAMGPMEEIPVVACGDTVFFNMEIMGEIITPSCNTAGCHNSDASGGYDLTTYNSVNSNAGIIFNVIQHKNGFSAMPDGEAKLNDSLISKFDCWIQQGKLNN